MLGASGRVAMPFSPWQVAHTLLALALPAAASWGLPVEGARRAPPVKATAAITTRFSIPIRSSLAGAAPRPRQGRRRGKDGLLLLVRNAVECACQIVGDEQRAVRHHGDIDGPTEVLGRALVQPTLSKHLGCVG